MTAPSSRAATLVFLLTCVSRLLAATPDEAVAALEQGLLPALAVQGEPLLTVPLTTRMGQLGVPAISVAYFDHGRIQWAHAWGYADRERRVLATRDTLFQAGSLSQPVAAAAALRLVDRGELGLDQNINDRLTSWRVPDNAFTRTRKVTLRGLLDHTSGLTVRAFPGYERDRSPPPSLIRLLDGQGNTEAVRVEKTPGESKGSSGGGYAVLQLLLTDVTGLTFPDLLRKEVLGPLGLRSSTFDQSLPELMRARAASGTLRDGSAVNGGSHLHPELAASGLWTTASDLATFAIAVQAARDGQGTLLTRKSAQLMLMPALGADAMRFDLAGADFGFQGQLTAQPDGGPGIAILTNSDNGGRLASEVVMTLARAYDWKNAPVPEERKSVTVPPATLRTLAGRYVESSLGLDFLLVTRDGSLRMLIDGREQDLVAQSPERFFLRATGDTLTFRKEGDTMIAELPGGQNAVRIEP